MVYADADAHADVGGGDLCGLPGGRPERHLVQSDGRGLGLGEMANTAYNHITTPNGRSCAIMDGGQMMAPWSGQTPTSPGTCRVPPSSAHPGGVNVLAGDGSVRFVKDTVSLAAWRALGSGPGVRSSRRTPSESSIGRLAKDPPFRSHTPHNLRCFAEILGTCRSTALRRSEAEGTHANGAGLLGPTGHRRGGDARSIRPAQRMRVRLAVGRCC